MKSRKNRIKRSGSAAEFVIPRTKFVNQGAKFVIPAAEFKGVDITAHMPLHGQGLRNVSGKASEHTILDRFGDPIEVKLITEGGSKRKSRKSKKSKKTKTGRGAYEGGKKKCPKHCRRKTRHTRKRLKHRKN